jgi:argonaute-like protein implicated in RNA metabolism and viral defense
MAGSEDESSKMPQSPRTKGIIQYFERMVKTHNEGIDNVLLVKNDKIGQLEVAQITTNTKLAGLETTVARIGKSFSSVLNRFDEMHAAFMGGVM